ncbi:hypothetical protein D9M72_466170 [compost metagenome]
MWDSPTLPVSISPTRSTEYIRTSLILYWASCLVRSGSAVALRSSISPSQCLASSRERMSSNRMRAAGAAPGMASMVSSCSSAWGSV